MNRSSTFSTDTFPTFITDATESAEGTTEASHTVSGNSASQTIESVKVRVQIEHDSLRDLTGILEFDPTAAGESTRQITLFENLDVPDTATTSGARHFRPTFVTSNLGSRKIERFSRTTGGAEGFFLPAESLDQLKGLNPNGTWKLKLIDRVVGGGSTTTNWLRGFDVEISTRQEAQITLNESDIPGNVRDVDVSFSLDPALTPQQFRVELEHDGTIVPLAEFPYPNVQTSGSDVLFVEAVNGAIQTHSSPWEVQSATAPFNSNGTHIVSASPNITTSGAPRIDYTVRFQESGSYHLYVNHHSKVEANRTRGIFVSPSFDDAPTQAVSLNDRSEIVSYSGIVRGNAPVGYWRLGETSGTTADDSSTDNQDGTYTGTTLTAGISPDGNKARAFNGSTDHVHVPLSTSDALNVQSNFTLEAWVRQGKNAQGNRQYGVIMGT